MVNNIIKVYRGTVVLARNIGLVQIKIFNLTDLNLAIRYGVVTCIILADFNLVVIACTAKPPNLSHRQIFFPTIRYVHCICIRKVYTAVS